MIRVHVIFSEELDRAVQPQRFVRQRAGHVVDFDVVENLDGPAFLVEERLGLVEVDDKRCGNDRPVLAILLRLHFFVGIVQPVVGNVVHPLEGLFAVSAGGESGQ